MSPGTEAILVRPRPVKAITYDFVKLKSRKSGFCSGNVVRTPRWCNCMAAKDPNGPPPNPTAYASRMLFGNDGVPVYSCADGIVVM